MTLPPARGGDKNRIYPFHWSNTMKSELEMMAYYEEEHPTKTTTGKIEAAVTKALRSIFDVIQKTNKNASIAAEESRKAYMIAQHIDQRQAKLTKAEERAKAAYASTYKSNTAEDE
jgi:hypothetical protein